MNGACSREGSRVAGRYSRTLLREKKEEVRCDVTTTCLLGTCRIGSKRKRRQFLSWQQVLGRRNFLRQLTNSLLKILAPPPPPSPRSPSLKFYCVHSGCTSFVRCCLSDACATFFFKTVTFKLQQAVAYLLDTCVQLILCFVKSLSAWKFFFLP